jgi:hypothetical protein
MNYKPEDIVFWDPKTDRISYQGAIGFYDPGTYMEPPFFDLAIELHEIVPMMDYLKKQFPKGWKIENGEIIGL